MDPYLLLKWMHILSSTILFGTGIGTAFQMVWAMRNGDPLIISKVASGVVIADWIFTVPAGIVQPATGIALILIAGHDPFERWLLLTYALYCLAFVCWAPVAVLQIRIRDMACAAVASGTCLPLAARRAYRIWFALGWPAFFGLTLVFWLMVMKPALVF